jgi:hypothetical protein
MAGAAIKIFLNQIEKDIQIAICTGVNTILEKQTDKIGGIITENLNKLFEIEGIKKQLETLVTDMITKQFSTIFESEEIKKIFQDQFRLHLNKIIAGAASASVGGAASASVGGAASASVGGAAASASVGGGPGDTIDEDKSVISPLQAKSEGGRLRKSKKSRKSRKSKSRKR